MVLYISYVCDSENSDDINVVFRPMKIVDGCYYSLPDSSIMNCEKFENENSEILWQDRKRHLGLPISFTKYVISDDRLYTSTGLLNSTTNEILLYRILDVKCNISLFQRIFGVGTITLYNADQSDRELKLLNIKNPKKVHKYISSLVEEKRTQTGVKGKEIFGTAGINVHGDSDGDGLADCIDFND